MLKNYIKMALKVLLRRKVFTCISLFTISFTLMVLMVMTALFRSRLWLLPAGDAVGSHATPAVDKRENWGERVIYSTRPAMPF